MGSIPSELSGCTTPATKAIEHKTNTISDHALTSATHKPTMDEIAFPFLSLPVELQTGIMNYLRDYSDLKALCLASKHVSEIATPRLYYELDLRNEGNCHALPMMQRIRSLLIQPANLHFVRIIKTLALGAEESQLMGRLLPLLRPDSLTELSFRAISPRHFPTPPQMEFIWNHQKNLQNQRLYSHMVPELDLILRKRGPSQTALLKSFTELNINDRTSKCSVDVRSMMSWPLKSLDLSILQRLRIGGLYIGDVVLSSLNTLFARGSFVNLRELTFSWIVFEKEMVLTNLPSLKVLTLRECTGVLPTLPLVIADDIRLSSFFGWIFGEVEEMIPVLAQIKGLECLHIKRRHRILAMDQAQKELVRAMISHKKTLRVLNLEESLSSSNRVDAMLWDFHIVKAIQSCRKLIRLSIPLLSNRSINYYREMIASFPDLETLTIYDSLATCANWSLDNAVMLFSASTNLETICFKGSLPNHPGTWEQRYERKELEQL